MQTTSQTQISTKLCKSCYRELHLGCFGTHKRSKDGLNSVCKDCRNYLRRRAYHKNDSNEEFIYPLNQHNHKGIEACLLQNYITDTQATMNGEKEFTVQILKIEPDVFQIYTENIKLICCSGKENFIKLALKILKEQKLRLKIQ